MIFSESQKNQSFLIDIYLKVRIVRTDSSMVQVKGLEPPRIAPLDPKSSASTNFATSAFASAKIQLIFQLKEEKDKKL